MAVNTNATLVGKSCAMAWTTIVTAQLMKVAAMTVWPVRLTFAIHFQDVRTPQRIPFARMGIVVHRTSATQNSAA
jgi:hypothetical protein